ncbi:MAG: WD40 repeat domain-containing protein [Pirellulaceae bacterium]
MKVTALLLGILAAADGNTLAQRTPPPVTAIAVAPDKSAVITGSQAGLVEWSWPALERRRELSTQFAHIHDLAFSPDGQTLGVAGGTPAESGGVEFWSWPAGTLARRWNGPQDVVYAIDWDAAGGQVAAASMDGTVSLLDAASGTLHRQLVGHSRAVLAAAYLPGTQGLVTAGADESLRLWNLPAGTVIRTLANHTRSVHDLAVRPGATAGPAVLASAGDDRTVRLWQPVIGRLMRFARLNSAPRSLGWTPDGRSLVVACRDGHLLVVDPDSVEVRHSDVAIPAGIFALAVVSDTEVAVGGPGGIIRRIEIPRWDSVNP